MTENKITFRHLLLFVLLSLSALGVWASEPIFSKQQESVFIEDGKFLDIDDAFIISTDLLAGEFIIRWVIADGYYLYKHRFAFSATGVDLAEPLIPDGLQKTDEYFGEVEVYYKHIEINIAYQNLDANVILTVKYQGCADAGLCYTPATRNLNFQKQADGTFALVSGLSKKIIPDVNSTSAIVVAEDDGIPFSDQTQTLSMVLAEENIFWIIIAFFGAGLLLTFTPCVLPMIPILSGIIAGQGDDITPARAFRLSLVYVQSMAITYALLGVLVVQAGSSLSGYLQSPVIISVIAGIFVLLALSMFGLYEVKLPAFMEKYIHGISEKQRGGNYLGVAFMGIISTLIVSPCTSAPLTAALLFIANSGEHWIGGLSLYFLGMGMGIPLLIIGISEGRLLPSAGDWMESVKKLFGFIMLAMALYISDHLISGPVYLLLWGALLILAASFFGVFARANSTLQLLRKSLAIIVLLIGIIYLTGGVMGNKRLLRPLENMFATSSVSKLDFRHFSSLGELNVLLKQARQSNQPVMIDFFAEWCVACYELEDYTFSDVTVQTLLAEKNVLLLQADVTANSAADLELLDNYNILGLPSILFFQSNGIEHTAMRVTGYEDAETFRTRLVFVFQ